MDKGDFYVEPCSGCIVKFCCSGSIQSECSCRGFPIDIISTDYCSEECLIKKSKNLEMDND